MHVDARKSAFEVESFCAKELKMEQDEERHPRYDAELEEGDIVNKLIPYEKRH